MYISRTILWYRDWMEQLHTYFEPVPDIGTCHLATRDPRQFLFWLRCILIMGKGKNSDLSILVIGGSLDDNSDRFRTIKIRFKI